MKKPHIVIIMADHLRADCIGPFTPNICKLKEESAVFEHAYCASPLCVPARGSFFTGKYPNVTGSLNNAKIKEEYENGYVRKEHATLYELLEDEWDSWHTGKHDLYTENKVGRRPEERTHWLPMEPRYKEYLAQHGKRAPGGQDFRTYVPETVLGKVTRRAPCSRPHVGRYEDGFEHFVDGFITRDTMAALRERSLDKPLLLNAMYFAPHPPFDIPEPWYSRFRDVEMPDSVGRWGHGQSPLQMYNLPGMVGSGYTREEWQRVWDVYTGYVSLFDDCVGQIVNELKRQRIYDETLIVLTSDHGEMLGSHCLFQKMCMYEESVCTPLFMKFPQGEHAGIAISATVSAVDVLPTLCDYVRIQAHDTCGASLLPLLRGETPERAAIFIQYDGNGSRGNLQRCVVSGRTKLIVDVFKDETFVELYRLDEDPQEMRNLAFDEGEEATISALLQLLRDHMAHTGDKLQLADRVHLQCKENYAPFI